MRTWSSASECTRRSIRSGVSVVVSTVGFSHAARTGNSRSSSVQAWASTSFRSSASKPPRARSWKTRASLKRVMRAATCRVMTGSSSRMRSWYTPLMWVASTLTERVCHSGSHSVTGGAGKRLFMG